MNFLNQKDVNDIIEEIGVPCKDPKALLSDLNYWIVERGYLSDKKPPNANQQKEIQKKISQENNALHNSRLGCLEGALKTIIFRSEKMPFLKQAGIEEQKIEHAKEVLEALIKLELESVKHVPMDIKDFEERECAENKFRPIRIFKYQILPDLYEEYFGGFKNYASHDHNNMSPGINFIKLITEKLTNIHTEASTISKGYQRHHKKARQ